MGFALSALALIGGGSAAAGAVTAASAAITVGSGIAQANAQRKAGQAAQEQATTAAAQQEAAAEQARLEANEQIARTRMEQRRYRGAQRAALAASGIVATGGSAMEILGRTAALQELEIQDMARRRSAEYGAGYAQAREIRVAGRAAETGARRAATGTILGTVGGALGNLGSAYIRGRSLIP